MKFSIAAFIATAVSLAAALEQTWTTPTKQDGNPIHRPGLQDKVPVGKPFTITWTPTTGPGETVTLLLLRGPSTNVIPISVIASKIENSGSFVWTPSTTLEDDDARYGIQLIVDSNGEYQYTTQFGVSNPDGPTGGDEGDDDGEDDDVPPTNTTTTATTASSSSTISTSTSTTALNATTTSIRTTKPTTLTTLTTSAEPTETTAAPTEEETTATPSETETPAVTTPVEGSAGRTVASFAMGGFLVAAISLFL